jgi:hypothetical protein
MPPLGFLSSTARVPEPCRKESRGCGWRRLPARDARNLGASPATDPAGGGCRTRNTEIARECHIGANSVPPSGRLRRHLRQNPANLRNSLPIPRLAEYRYHINMLISQSLGACGCKLSFTLLTGALTDVYKAMGQTSYVFARDGPLSVLAPTPARRRAGAAEIRWPSLVSYPRGAWVRGGRPEPATNWQPPPGRARLRLCFMLTTAAVPLTFTPNPSRDI